MKIRVGQRIKILSVAPIENGDKRWVGYPRLGWTGKIHSVLSRSMGFPSVGRNKSYGVEWDAKYAKLAGSADVVRRWMIDVDMQQKNLKPKNPVKQAILTEVMRLTR